MKRTISSILLLVVMLTMCRVVFAASVSKATVTVGEAVGNIGDIVAVDVSLSAQSELGAVQIRLDYDSECLRPAQMPDQWGDPVYWVRGDLVKNAGGTVMATNGKTPTVISVLAIKGLHESGVLCTVYLEIIDNLGDGIPITSCVVDFEHYQNREQTYEFTVEEGIILPVAEESSVESSLPPSEVTPNEPSEDTTSDTLSSETPVQSSENSFDDVLSQESSLLPSVNTPTEPSQDNTPTQPSEPSDILFGDVDGNQKVDAVDALMVLQYAVGKGKPFTDDQSMLADMDQNGILDAVDALYILKKAVGK